MAGLLEKDIRLLWGTKQTLVILFAIAVAVAISTIAYDEMDHGYQFLLTLPINKKTYVREKYLLCAGGVVAAWVIAVGLYLVSKVVRGIPVVVAEDILTAAVILLIILLISFFMIPAQFFLIFIDFIRKRTVVSGADRDRQYECGSSGW